MMTVETDRLLLRPWREDDGVELQRLFSDAAVIGGRNLPPERIARLGESSLRQWRVNGFGPWAAVEKTTGSWIGRLGLDELEDWPEVDRIEVGFELHRAPGGAAASPPKELWRRLTSASSSTAS